MSEGRSLNTLSTDSKNISSLVDALIHAAKAVRDIESQARDALFARDDSDTYRKKLEEKAILLMELPHSMEPILKGLDPRMREEILARLVVFARNAGQALDLSSPFYLSALLYPEDYAEGDRNDLEEFIERFRKKYL